MGLTALLGVFLSADDTLISLPGMFSSFGEALGFLSDVIYY